MSHSGHRGMDQGQADSPAMTLVMVGRGVSGPKATVAPNAFAHHCRGTVRPSLQGELGNHA
jgi:hypothetical protein